MDRNQKGETAKTSDWPHELRWRFGQVWPVDELGEIQPIHFTDIGGDELQRALKPEIFQNITEGARALFVETLEHALHNTAIDCDQILRKINVEGYDGEPELFSPDWYKAGEPPKHEDGFLVPTDDNHAVAAPRRYCDNIKPFTPEYYAGETLERCRKLLWFFKAPFNRSPSSFNDTENLLMAALETGRLIAEAEFRQGHEPTIVKQLNSRRGYKNLEGINQDTQTEKYERQIYVERFKGETDRTKGALVLYIKGRLEEVGYFVSGKTIQRDLEDIREREAQR